jgi:hypothetical protein
MFWTFLLTGGGGVMEIFSYILLASKFSSPIFFSQLTFIIYPISFFLWGLQPGTRPKMLQPQRLQSLPIFIGTMIIYSTLPPPPPPVSMLELAIHWDNLVFASNETNHTIYWFVYSTLPPPSPCFCWRFNQIQIFIELGATRGATPFKVWKYSIIIVKHHWWVVRKVYISVLI